MKKFIIILLGLCVLFFSALGLYSYFKKQNTKVFSPTNNDNTSTSIVSTTTVNNFADCVTEGNPVMESYPRQCISKDGQHFTEETNIAPEFNDRIILENPKPNQIIKSPLLKKGQVRGLWFFEGSFPVVLTDWDGLIIAQGVATAQDDWMTADFVPFEATLTFEAPTYKNNGSLILKKDNPSGLPANDAALEIPVFFEIK